MLSLLPPLARRRVDILAWLARLAADWAAARGLARPPQLQLTPSAAAAILRHRWPENLRGLLRLVHELAHRGDGPVARESLPAWLDDDAHKPATTITHATPAPEPTPAPAAEAAPAGLVARNVTRCLVPRRDRAATMTGTRSCMKIGRAHV